MKNALDIQIKKHQYGSIVALENCHFQLPKGSFCAIVGPNGAGKSTLLKMISGLIAPTQGYVQSSFDKKNIAYLPQSSQVDLRFPFKVEDVVAMGLWKQSRFFGSLYGSGKAKIKAALQLMGLSDFEQRPLQALSGGQLQRVLFSRLMVQEADLILLDEPFAGIDEPTINHLMGVLLNWNCEGKTIVVVLHDLQLVRKYIPDAILVAKSLIAFGKTGDVLTPDNITKAAFHV